MIAAIIADLNGDTKSQQTHFGEYFESQEQRIHKARCCTAIETANLCCSALQISIETAKLVGRGCGVL